MRRLYRESDDTFKRPGYQDCDQKLQFFLAFLPKLVCCPLSCNHRQEEPIGRE